MPFPLLQGGGAATFLTINKVIMGTLNGKTFAISGTLSKVRKHFIETIENAGGKFVKNVSNRVNFLIVGADAYEKDTTKLEKARSLDLFLITESEFMKMLNPS